MIGEHEAGKGSASRVKDLKKYGEGYSGIQWNSKKPAKVKPAKKIKR